MGGYDSPNYINASPPGGWNEVLDQAGGNSTNGLSIYWKFAASSSETNPQFTFASATQDRHTGLAVSLTGVNTTSPIGTVGTLSSADGSVAPTPHSSSGIVAIGSTSLGLYLDQAYYGDGNGISYKLDTPSGWTEWYDKPVAATTTDGQNAGGYKSLTQGVGSGNISVNGGEYWSQVQIEIRGAGDSVLIPSPPPVNPILPFQHLLVR